jgi:hypothetical protein
MKTPEGVESPPGVEAPLGAEPALEAQPAPVSPAAAMPAVAPPAAVAPAIVEPAAATPPAPPTRKRRRCGRPRGSGGELRSIMLSCMATPTEAAHVRALAEDAGWSVAELLRRLALGRRIPRAIPRVNLETWARLGPLAANLDQYLKAVRRGQAADAPAGLLVEIRDLVDALRQELRRRDP